jgi:hypothetical protein
MERIGSHVTFIPKATEWCLPNGADYLFNLVGEIEVNSA